MLAGVELIEKLGQGGMGVVWKARQLSLDRLVAIKVIPPEMIRSPDDVRMILQEARAAAKLKHPGIVQIHDACEQDGTYYLVMEYVEGYNLGQWLARRKQLGVKDVLLIAESVATALDYAWQATGLIHCDIKPENVMVDQDGTIKVADLGLSRTRDAKDGVEIDEVMGTPAYMSPEQVQGDRNLDCRTDIYSLGAMMYHLLTGVRPFSDKTDDEAMASQITSYLCDPRDIVPSIPGCVCALIERMMVKDRAGRPADWARVLADLRRVGRGMLPTSPAPAPGTSTMTCRKVVASKTGKVQMLPRDEEGGGLPWRFVLLLVVLAIAGALYWYYKQTWGRSPTSAAGSILSTVQTSAPEPERAVESMKLLEETRRWVRTNSNAYEAAFARYRAMVERFPDTVSASMALEDMKKLRLRQAGQVDAAWGNIQACADQFMTNNQFDQALAYVEKYEGACKGETASNRMELAKGIRAKIAEQEVARTREEAWSALIDQTADLILASKFKAAFDGVQEAIRTGACPDQNQALAELSSILQESLECSARVRQSFVEDVGRVVLLPIGRARIQVRITGLSGQRIAGTMVDTGAEVLIHPDDLPADERLRRMGEGTTPGMALAKGVLAAGVKMFPLAEDMFGRTGGPLSKVLRDKLRFVKAGMGTEQVVAAFGRVLNTAGISVGPYSETDWITAIEQARLSPDRARVVNEQREKFLMEYGASEFVIRATPVLLALERQCQLSAEVKPESAATKVVTESSGEEKNIEQATIVRGLVGRNPGVQPRDVTTYPVNGGAGIKVVSDSVVDVGFVAEGGVKGLWLEAKGGSDLKIDVQPLAKAGVIDLRMKGYVPKDLAVLRSIPLRHLTLTGINPASYSWLEGLSLTELDLSGSGLRELSALRGMRLQKLVLENSKVTGVSPLAGMPLRELSLKGTSVRDIVVLRGLPLVALDLSQTPVMDCSILRGMNLSNLDLSRTSVRDISFCAGMPLERLAVSGTSVEDISFLRGKNFKRLVLSRTQVTDISPLSGATIGTLDIGGTRIPSVNLLRVLPQMRIQELSLEDMDVTRLDCIKGQQLTRLSLKGTRVSDISPLAEMPLKILDIRGLRVTDTSVLHSISSLELLWCDVDGLQAGVLFDQIPGLTSINGQGRAEYVRW